jgi:hypothetical protein
MFSGMTDGRWILDGLLGSAMRDMPGMSSVGGRRALPAEAEIAERAAANEPDPSVRATTGKSAAPPRLRCDRVRRD